MRPPRIDAFQMLLVEIARPPGDFRGTAGEIDHMLAGTAAGLDHVAGFPVEKRLQHRPDRPMIAVKRRRVEATVRLDRPAILAEFDDMLSHHTPLIGWQQSLSRWTARALQNATDMTATPEHSAYSGV